MQALNCFGTCVSNGPLLFQFLFWRRGNIVSASFERKRIKMFMIGISVVFFPSDLHKKIWNEIIINNKHDEVKIENILFILFDDRAKHY